MDDSTHLQTYVRHRSEAAFTALVERYLPLVHAAALRRLRGDEHRAREVTQLVFIELARKAARLVSHPALAAWLHQSTRWHAANLERTERRRAHHERAAACEQETVQAPASGGSSDAEWTAIRPVLDAALDSLREADREAVLQRYFLDRTYAEIGRQMGANENTARVRVERALERLRIALRPHGITSSAAALGVVMGQQASAAATPLPTLNVAAITRAAMAVGANAATGTTTGLLVTKVAAGLAAGLAAFLAGALWMTESSVQHLRAELAALQSEKATRTDGATPDPLLSEADIQAIEEEVLAAAEIVVQLTPEQQERARLDMIIRKGELDGTYAPLFREMRLPAETLDRFKTLLVERNQAIYDARQLAKDEGVVFASLAEEQEVVRSVLPEIDAAIAGVLGPDHFAQFREYEDLAPYRKASAALANHLNLQLTNPKHDEHVRACARLLRETAPDYPNRLYCANEWPVKFPSEFIEAVRTQIEPAAAERLEWENEKSALARQMGEIAREAALDGKLGSLSDSVERQYQAERTRRAAEVTP